MNKKQSCTKSLRREMYLKLKVLDYIKIVQILLLAIFQLLIMKMQPIKTKIQARCWMNREEKCFSRKKLKCWPTSK